jgi:hypothetical protein
MARKPLTAGFTGNVVPETGITAKAKTAVRNARQDVGMVAAHAVDHPASTGSAVALIGLFGLTIGYLLGVTSAGRRR